METSPPDTWKAPTSVYIHLPFCTSRCPYCDFFSTTGQLPVGRYLAAVKREWQVRRGGEEPSLQTLYLGGGTPSIWPPAALEELIGGFSKAEGCEVTVEANPGDADAGWFAGLAAAGANRFSIGAQAFDDKRLVWLGRRHGVSDIEKAVAFGKSSGAAVSVDIIYGTPEQTPRALRCELERALDLGVEHISAYELGIPKGSPLDRQLTGRARETIEDDARAAALWHLVGDVLNDRGWERYEVSSYCRPGFRSRHNQVYWSGEPYVGLGAGAHGFHSTGSRFVRYANAADVENYVQGTLSFEEAADSARPIGTAGRREELTGEEHAVELVMLGLRFADGVDLSRLEGLLSVGQMARWNQVFDRWIVKKEVVRRGAHLLPTPRGMLRADGLAAELPG